MIIVGGKRLMAAVSAAVLLVGGCGSDDNSPAAATANSGPPIECAAGTLNVAGNSSLKKVWSAWVEAYQRQCRDSALNFDGQGSGYGRTQFIQKHIPMASSLASLAGDQRNQAQQRCAPGAAIDLPMAIIPIGLAYSLPGVGDLTLTPALFARIYEGKIKKWNDPQIVAVNQGVSLPNKDIVPVFFSADAGTSENITRFLVSQVPAEWPHAPSQTWPNSIGVGAAISTTIVLQIKNNDGAIGYVDYPDAVDNKLTLAGLDTGNGPVKISPTSVAKVIDATKLNQQGQDITLDLAYGLHQTGAYPAIMFTYFITCTQGLAAEEAKFVRSFLTFAASSAGQQIVQEANYIPLPDVLRDKVQAAIAQLPAK